MVDKKSSAYKRGFAAWSAQPGNPYHEDDFRSADFIAGQEDGRKANEERLREFDQEYRDSGRLESFDY